ncbi:MAG: 30S ribosomal protein S12 methylthiotransferase RimO [Clostridiales bacterium]|nr:30S ribosomal protein S12 methylthiotransferase RimO [Clostridiales bacterium]
MSYKIGIISLGCPKNQVDAEIMLALLLDAGFEIVDFYEGADAVIINTCTFIDDAKQEAIDNILEVVDLKKEGTVRKVIVTGCMAQLYKEEILEEIPQVDAVLGIGSNSAIVENIESVIEGEGCLMSFPPRSALPLEGARVLTTPSHWAYLRIAEGCSNNCSFCLIPKIRGAYRSRPMEELFEEASDLAEKGVKELIIIAQDTSAYGIDLYEDYVLPDLLEKLSQVKGIEWIRLMYCYPDFVSDRLIETMRTNSKVLHYIDIPIQHADDRILKAMNRNFMSRDIKELVSKLRKAMPDIIIRSTFICGFPGEDEAAFSNLSDLVNELALDRCGCFVFSPQEGTAAYELDGQVDEEEALRRADLIMQDQYEIMTEKNQNLVGKKLKVMVEGYDRYTDSYFGRSYMDAPEIDSKVIFTSDGDHDEGDFLEVEIFGVSEYDLLGRR